MQVITKEEFDVNKKDYLERIMAGEIFIYPTDTIYGIGCDATNPEAVAKIREIKERPVAPFSIIAPGKGWIFANCDVNGEAEEWLDELPGPYTLVMPLKNKDAIAKKEVIPVNDAIGVRIPGHWISLVAEGLDIPLVTTSVNKSGRKFMASLDDLDPDIKGKVNFAIDAGTIEGRPSKIVHLELEEKVVRER